MMKTNKTGNPLRKRLPRELKKDYKKYLALLILLSLTIGCVAAMFVANNSMEAALTEGYEKYNIEDGHFELEHEPTKELLDTFENAGISIYEQFYKDFDEDVDGDGTPEALIRVFKNREEVNRICLMEGAFPETDDEIVIDRMHADNHSITIGSTIYLNGKPMKVTGLVAFSDYSTLYKSNTDTMFDALSFNIGAVTASAYDLLDAAEVYQYAFQYKDRPADNGQSNELSADVEQQKEMSDELIKKLGTLAATGGYLDDPDEAEALADKIDEWTDLIDEVQAEGDKLTERKDELEAEAKVLEAEGDALKEEGEELEKEGASLQAEQQKLMKTLAPTLMQLGIPMDLSANSEPDPEAIKELMPYLPESMQSKVEDLQTRADDLESRADDLQERGDDLQARADELEAKGDELQADADALQPKIDEAEAAGDELKKLEPYEDHQNELTDYVPEYLNHALHFAPDDFGSDKAMSEVLLNILVVVLAFVFAITASNEIVSESAVIGTLRASGYTKGELIRHYMTMPLIITLIASVIGNIIGYTALKYVVVNMYYNSYSLPTYVTRWNTDALIRTTIVPVTIMLIVNLCAISIKMRYSPLQFLRHDLSNRKKKRAVKLPNFRFMSRFRLRILFHNIPGYLVLFLGIAFVNLLLGFAVGLPSTLKNYQDHATDYMLVDYQYVLMGTEDDDGNEITTLEPSAEKYSMNSLETIDGPHVGETVTVYGYMDDSRYFHPEREISGNEIYVTDAYAAKFGLKEGQEITLKEEYTPDTYVFSIAGIYEMPGTVGILMPNDEFNRTFDLDEGNFTGYLSENEITDIDEDMVATVITVDDILKMAKQLDHSLGGYMVYFEVICVILAIVIIYLLTKIIIERNAVSISMVKVLGYTQKEINSLYIRITSLVVVVSAVLGAYLSRFALVSVWGNVMNRLNGWFEFYSGITEILKMAGLILIGYAVVVFFDMRRIRRIPMTEALKNVE